MESDVITWKIVPNTVANRMKNHSLIHKLTSTRRLCRRSKAMNTAIKQSHGLKTYSQYVKIKTSILRTISDNSETDEDAAFTDDEYSIFHKSDKSLANYRIRMSKENKRNYQVKLESDENDIVLNGKNEQTAKDSKSKSSKNVKVGEQRVVKNNKIICPLARKKTKGKNSSNKYSNSISSQMDNDVDLSSQASNDNCSQKNHSNSANEISINTEACAAEKSIELCDKISTSSNKVMHDTSVLQEITNSSNELINSISRFNEISKKCPSNENQNGNTLDSPKVQSQSSQEEEGKKILPSSSSYNADEIRSGCDSYINIKTNSNQNLSLCLDENPKASTNEFAENDRSFAIDSLVTINTCQPKDSGIEEDTEEEFSERARKDCQNVENKIENTEKNMSDTSSPFNCNSNSTDIDVNLKLEHYSSDKSDSKDTTLVSKCGSTNDVEEPNKKVHKHKLQPKVTHTEIVNKKYKIISNDTYLSNVCANLEESSTNDFSCERVRETEDVEDGISILTKNRLEKLRKLNLTTDSDSSLSENEDAYCNVENMREKLLKRSEESSDASDDIDDNVHSDREISIQFDKNLENGKDSEKESNKKESKAENCLEKEANCPADNDDIPRQCKKVKKDSLLHVKDSTLSNVDNKPVQEKCHSLVRTAHHFDQVEDVKGSEENNSEIKNTMQAVNKKATRRHRPCNVQEFVEEENLMVETTIPSFTFKNIEEDDELFVIDVPSMIFQSQLVGKKMVLTEKMLKLGKRKYRVKYRNVDNISCVFASGKSRKPYKTVNIQPVARVVAREKITRKSLGKWSNLYNEM